MKAQKRSKDLMVGAVVGSVLGAVTALLLAPKSGRELRNDIVDGYQQVSEKTQRLAENVADKSKQIVSAVSETSQSTAENIGRHTSDWAGKVKGVAIQVGEEVKTWKKGSTAPEQDDIATAEASVAATTAEREEA
ncbi:MULTISPECIES: YtxH domain-containing protein [unclassified Paenibacillus]|uniref:YtxH domain-containing protein n=1 Tax=unclassified Paenibacillus TaxID=185978 RepID=UPI001AE62605|nr:MULTISPECIES: YtxH domain-containing protein [unclassified Paenibacillus]MBP1154700.1 gas vesicle protein [Paenibacillus sp. PvP091]MBP1169916.1 gas vesicle protein [Paenibacillus sp. PvR098]MBP2440944.1 gas vesicle protein [Paenibacillus sp. PvP052]